MLKRIQYYSEHTKCETYFTITGDFLVDDVTSIIKLQPFNSWNKGDKRTAGNGEYTFSRWSYGLCDNYDVETSNMVNLTLKDLFDKKEELNMIKEKYADVYFGLVIIPTVRHDESTPTLSLSMEAMKWCVETGTNIDIDLYVSCPEGDIDDYTLNI